MSENDTVEVPRELVKELADNHKEVARYGYKNNRTGMADKHHSWARRLNETTERDYCEVANDE